MIPQRHLFDIPDGVTYLNHAYLSPTLRAARAAGEQALAVSPWEIESAHFFADSERLRGRFGALLGDDAEGVALVPSVSYGVGVAAANLPLRAGDRVVVLEEQFPSNVYAWARSAGRAGATVVTVPRARGEGWTEGVVAAIDERTAVVAVPQGHWTDGSQVDLVAVGAAARAAGAALVVDGSQTIGAHPFDVAAIQPDFVVAAGYKWLLGPYSLGYLWAAPHRRDGVPLEHNWITRGGSEDFTGLVDYRDDYQAGARRYDMGERSNFVAVPMAIAALDQVTAWGVEAIAAHGAALVARAAARGEELGLQPTPPGHRASCLVGIRCPGGFPPSVAKSLAAERIFVSMRGDSMRVSAHAYNGPDDIDRLCDVLAGLL